MTLDVRVLGPGDVVALSAEMARAADAGDMRASSDPDGAFILRFVAADPGQFGGAFAGGELVGIISPEIKIAIVRPDRRRQGIGRALVELGLEMERPRGRPDLLLGALPDEPVARAFLTACGFSFHSVVYDLDLPADRAVVAPAWPAGLVARSFERERDVEPWVALFNTAFADHPTPLELSPAFVARGLDDPDFVDADTIVVEEEGTGELIGFCATEVQRRDGAIGTSAELWSIGVRPDRQGQGIGRQLVRAGVGRVRSLGIVDVHLSVNARNASALGLYEDEGFVRSRTRERYARPVEPVVGLVTEADR
jgi:mycothiol synthase